MKVLAISRPVSNAGDWLMKTRGLDLFHHVFSNAQIEYAYGDRELDTNHINEYDVCIVFSGPIYDNRLLTAQMFPLVKQARQIKIPICFFGCGWYGVSDDDRSVYSYKFSDEAKSFLKYCEGNRKTIFGCRDTVTLSVLKNNGIQNVVMTGCPAWYDLRYIDCTSIAEHVHREPKVICVSDPGLTKNPSEQIERADQAISVIQALRKKYPGADFLFTFNNGIQTKYSTVCNERIADYLGENNIPYFDISGSCQGFSHYDQADLHVGFRVHSHIYSLSRRIPSVLIEEDARGGGMDETLNLIGVKGYDVTHRSLLNPYAANKVLDVIDTLWQNNGDAWKNAFVVMKNTFYSIAVPFLKKLEEQSNL